MSLVAMMAEGGGFDPLVISFGQYFWTWVIFLVSLPLMWKNVFKPICQALETRDRKAEDAITSAVEAQKAAEAARNEIEQRLEETRVETQTQLKDARERAEKQANDLLAKARAEAEADRSRAVAEIDAERRRAVAEIRDLAVDVSLDAAGKLMKREMKGDDQKAFVSDFISNADASRN